MKKINKVVLAYSGGLDTSVILRWLKENYQCEVVTFTADLGQEEDFSAVEAKAKQQGTSEIYIEDLKEEFENKDIIAYTSGLGGLFKPGVPIGKIENISDGKINFFSDFTQLNYVKIISYRVGGKK